jgi:4-amino-4-deoxy-L-arabinose transferase-like glycosyltransferase
MRAFLVTGPQAGKLPRWGLWLLCLLYAVPGLLGRDPWRYDDAAGFGVAWSMARGGTAQWLMPAIAGEAVHDEGPLPFWLAAFAIRLLPWVPAHAAAQAATTLGLLLLFAALWYASYRLASRPGLQPLDPFDAKARPVDFGRAIADSTLLALMASVGVIARLHETSAEAHQLVWVAIFLYGAARALEAPVSGGLIAGAAIAATVCTRGLLPAVALTVTAIALPLLASGWRVVARRWLTASIGAGLIGSLAWPVGLALSGLAGADAHLAGWLAWNRSQFGGLDAVGLLEYLRTAPWYFWPAWPIAVWAILRWRGRLDEPAVALPLAAATTLGAAALIGSVSPQSQLLPPAAPLAMLAAIGLPTLRRSVTALIDWFAVMSYTLIGIIVWAYWLAWLLGTPPRMAAAAAALSPGFTPQWEPGKLAIGAAATLAWLALVRWRLARHRPALWRPLALSCGGLVLAWLLLMTLWLPAIDHRNTYRAVAGQIAARLPADEHCVHTDALGRAQRASLHYFGGLRLAAAGERCDWLLVAHTGESARSAAPARPGWELVWEGSRPRDRGERLRLYRRP